MSSSSTAGPLLLVAGLLAAVGIASCAQSDPIASGDDGVTPSGGASAGGEGGREPDPFGGAGTGGTGGGGLTGPTCGDNVIDAGEECDGFQLGGADCGSVVGAGSVGALGCTTSCTYDPAACSAPPSCGNGMIDGAGEECDLTELGGVTCESILGVGSTGAVTCTAGCKIDASACTPPPSCNDGILNGSEECDGTNFGTATCASELGNPGASGALLCNANCTINTANCVSCGDGVVSVGEQCDTLNLNGASCGSVLGAGATGTLGCNANCTFNTAGCAVCGDGTLQSGEQCDDGNTTSGDGCESCQVVCLSGEQQFGLNCYADVTGTANWTTAQNACAGSLGGHLVTISSAAENNFVWGTVMTFDSTIPRWIGLTDTAVENNFVWVTGEPLLVTNWASGEPNNSGNEDCAEFDFWNNYWNDEGCGEANSFICEYEPPVLNP